MNQVMQKEHIDALNKMGIPVNAAMFQNTAGVQDTVTTGQGTELVPDTVLQDSIIDIIPKYSTFLSVLKGFHGTNMDKQVTRPVIGDVGFFNMVPENTAGFTTPPAATNTLATADVTITQRKFNAVVDITDELRKFNVLGEAQFQQLVERKISAAMARTIESAIINGDTATGAGANINNDTAALAATDYRLSGNGLRKTALGDGDTVDVGAQTFGDWVSLASKLGDNGNSSDDCLWLADRATYLKALDVTEFKSANINGRSSTIYSGSIDNVLGSDLITPRDLYKSKADGVISATAASNTTGNILYFRNEAVQYGYGSDGLQMYIHNYGSYGVKLDVWFYCGFTIVDKLAGNNDPMVVQGINVTL